MRRRIPLALLALTACATKPTPSPQLLVQTTCLPMPSYSRQEEAKAADELQALPQGSMLARMIRDYGAMRAADRACEGVR